MIKMKKLQEISDKPIVTLEQVVMYKSTPNFTETGPVYIIQKIFEHYEQVTKKP